MNPPGPPAHHSRRRVFWDELHNRNKKGRAGEVGSKTIECRRHAAYFGPPAHTRRAPPGLLRSARTVQAPRAAAHSPANTDEVGWTRERRATAEARERGREKMQIHAPQRAAREARPMFAAAAHGAPPVASQRQVCLLFFCFFVTNCCHSIPPRCEGAPTSAYACA